MEFIDVRPGLRIIAEKTYTAGSVDNQRIYSREFRTNSDLPISTAYGIARKNGIIEEYPLILLGSRCPLTLNQDSYAYFQNRIFVAIDTSIVAIDEKTLTVIWVAKVDAMICFGVYWVKNIEALISWGELEIACIDFDGKLKWSVSGKDIFTEDFRIEGDTAYVTDFEKGKYQIDLKFGKIKMEPRL
jgi:hypothetical protein